MAEFVPGKNRLSFNPVDFSSSRETSGWMRSFSQLSFKIIEGGAPKALAMKSFQDIGQHLSYVILSTADSVDPDKATEEQDLLSYELQDGEYLVRVELHGKEGSSQAGNMHQIFVKNLRSWDFYTDRYAEDNSPREVAITFDIKKEPFVKGITFSTSAPTETSTVKSNDRDYKLKGLTLNQNPLVFVQDCLAMRYKHDDIVYEISPKNFVSKHGPETIYGVKTFDALPKSSGMPVDANDLVTKEYVDTLSNKEVAVTIKAMLNSDWCGTSEAKFFLLDGSQLSPLKMEDGSLKEAKEPKLMVFTLEPQSGAAPTKVPKQELLAYKLKPKEFFAEFYPSHLIGKAVTHATTSYQDPFGKGGYLLTGGSKEILPQYMIIFKGLSQSIAKVSFGSNSYTPSKTGASCTIDDMTEDGAETTGTSKFNYQFSDAITSKIKLPVYTADDQLIYGTKTFATLPKSSATPAEDDDLVTKKYLDNELHPSKDVSITITAETSSSQSNWCGISNVQLFLDKDVQLFPLKMESGPLNALKEPKLMIFTTEKQSSPAPTKVAKQEILDYQLRPGDFRGLLYTADVLGKNTVHSSETWQDPFTKGQGYLTYGSVLNTPEPQLKLVVQDLGQVVAKVGVSEASYAAQNIKVSSTIRDITEEGTKTTGTNTNNFAFGKTLGGVFQNPVLTTGDQSISGVKTFAVPPKSVAPAAPDDLVTKNYVDNTFLQSPKSDVDIRIGVKSGTSAWNAFSHLNIVLANGKRLEAKYMEDVIYQDATPAKVVLKTADNTEDIAPAPTRQAKDFFDTYQLADGEFFAELIFANGVGNGRIHSNKEQACPWDAYLVGNLNKDEIADLFKLTIKQLDVTIDYVQIHCGDNHNGYGYLPKYFYLVAAANGADTGEIKSKEGLTNKEIIKFAIPKGSLAVGLGSFVTVDSTQTISGVKTFSKLPKSTVEPIEATELATKAYVDAKSGMSNSDIPEQEVTVFSKSSSSAIIAFSKLKLFLGNGTQIYPIFYEKQSSYGALDAPLNVVFSIAPAYHNGEPTIPYPNEKPKDELDSYVLKNGEFKGAFTPVNLCGGKYVFATASGYNSDSWKLPWNNYAVFSNGEKDSTPILRINIKGKLPSITKVSFTADGAYFGDKFSASVGVNGSNGKQSEELQSATEKLCDLVCEDSKLYNDFYLDTVSNQTAFGIKSFLNCPKIITEQPQLKNESTNVMSFANVAHSIGIGVPEKQYITLNSSTTWNKQSAGGSNWTYTLSLNVYYSNLVPAFISPITGQITPLYIKYYCSDGRAVLTTEGTQMPDKGAVEAKSTSEMDSYRLKYNEYLCRFYWYFLNKLGNTKINGEWITKNSRDGSKVLDLFTNSSGSWASYTTGQLKDPTNYDGPASAAFVEFYNVPTIRFIKAYCSASSAGGSTAKLYCSQYGMLDTKSNGKGTASAEYNSSEFKEFDDGNRFDLHAGYPSGPVELMRVAPIIALMQENISKLEERIKALESPKP